MFKWFKAGIPRGHVQADSGLGCSDLCSGRWPAEWPKNNPRACVVILYSCHEAEISQEERMPFSTAASMRPANVTEVRPDYRSQERIQHAWAAQTVVLRKSVSRLFALHIKAQRAPQQRRPRKCASMEPSLYHRSKNVLGKTVEWSREINAVIRFFLEIKWILFLFHCFRYSHGFIWL